MTSQNREKTITVKNRKGKKEKYFGQISNDSIKERNKFHGFIGRDDR